MFRGGVAVAVGVAGDVRVRVQGGVRVRGSVGIFRIRGVRARGARPGSVWARAIPVVAPSDIRLIEHLLDTEAEGVGDAERERQ